MKPLKGARNKIGWHLGWRLVEGDDLCPVSSRVADDIRDVDDERDRIQDDDGAHPQAVGLSAWIEVEASNQKENEWKPENVAEAHYAGESEPASQHDQENEAREKRDHSDVSL